jgi:phosphinothricin acetyltransferase
MDAILRLATEADAGPIQAIYAPFCGDSTVSFEVVPPTREEMADRIRAVTARYPWLVCESGGVVLGYAYASRHRERAAYRWSVDASVYVREDARGWGVGRALYAALFEILRLQGFYRVFAGITLPNPASVGLHRSAGFAPVGTFHNAGFKCGAWRDVQWWERALQPPAEHPVEPVDVAAVSRLPAWDAALALCPPDPRT